MNTYRDNERTNTEPRLLLVTTVAITAQAFLLPIAQHFQERGWRVDAMASGITADDVCRSVFDQVWEARWSRSPLHLRNFSSITQLRDLVSANHYDIVHVHTPVAAFVTRLALNRLRKERNLQVLYTAHGFHFHSAGGVLHNTAYELLERVAASWTDFLVVMNQEDLRAAKDKGLIPAQGFRFMPGIGVDRAQYCRHSVSDGEVDQLYREIGIQAGNPLLLMIAEFTARKRHTDALRAFSRLADKQVHLVLAGDGPLLKQAKLQAASLGIAERVHFLGSRRDVPVLMKASRALILPSSQEGMPRCVLEAMSMGLPVIGSRIRGTTDLLEHGAGLLVDVGDIAGLAQAMRSILADAARAAEMGQSGLQQSAAYDLAHVLSLHEDLYGEAITSRHTVHSTHARSGVVHA